MPLPLSGQALSDTIGRIYDCAVDPGCWPETLALIRQELGFATASLNWMELPTGKTLLQLQTGIETRWLEAMGQYADDLVAQWGGREVIGRLAMSEPHVLTWVSPETVWKRTRYYREWAEPQGLIDLMVIGVARDATSVGSIGFGRHQIQGPVSKAEVEAARILVPHLQRAIAISKLLDVKSAMAATFESTVDLLAAAVLLLAEGRRIVHANASARAMLAEGTSIQSGQGGVLALSQAAAAAALENALARAAEDEAGIGRRGFGVPLRRADGTPMVLHVLPLRFSPLRRGLAPSAIAAVFVAPSVSGPPQPGEAFAALFDLTVAEARVLERLAGGATLLEVAAALEISQNTVKTHLARIFAKTGTRRQSELISLAASLALPG